MRLPKSDRARLFAYAALTLATVSDFAAAQKKPTVRLLPVKAGRPINAWDVPAEASLQLFQEAATIPPTPNARLLALHIHKRVRLSPSQALEVDREGLGERWTPIAMDTPSRTEWFAGGRNFHLTFFFRNAAWWVACVDTYESVQPDIRITCLDTDADGAYWEPNDYVRWGDGAFRAIGQCRDFDDGIIAGSLQLISKNKQPQFAFTELARPEGVDDASWTACRELNRMRNLHGMPPCTTWPEANTPLKQHANFLTAHDPKNENLLLSLWGQSEGLDGFDQAISDMSAAASIAWLSEKEDVTHHISRSLTAARDRSALFFARQGKLGIGRATNWSCMRAAPLDSAPGQRYCMVPAAGSKGVPRQSLIAKEGPFSSSSLFQQERGLPISIHIDPALVTGNFTVQVQSIALYALPESQPVAGFSFSFRDFDPNAEEHSFFFVPEAPLKPDTQYSVLAMIEGGRTAQGSDARGMTVDRLTWTFRTSP
jgi:hypothetical protein